MEQERTTPFTRNARLLTIAVVIVVTAFFLTAQIGKFKSLPEGQLPEPGLTPRNPFYALDTFTERTLLFLVVTEKRKVDLADRFAQEKLAEYQYLEAHPYGFYVGHVITENAKEEAAALSDYYRVLAGLAPLSIQAGQEPVAPEPLPQSGPIKSEEITPTSSVEAATSSNSSSYTPEALLATVAETTTRFLSQPLPPFQELWTQFYDRLPEFMQKRLNTAGAWIKQKSEQIQTWGEQKLADLVEFLKNQAKTKISGWIDRMVGFNRLRDR